MTDDRIQTAAHQIVKFLDAWRDTYIASRDDEFVGPIFKRAVINYRTLRHRRLDFGEAQRLTLEQGVAEILTAIA